MDEQTKKLRQLRLTIILTSIVGLLSFFSMTITTFAWGVGDTTLLYLLLYPTFLLSTILVIAKVRIGYFLTFLTAFTYAILLTSEVGKYLIFNFHNNVLFWVLLLPYLTFLTLIPLTAIFLTANFKFAKKVKLTSIILTLGLFILSIGERFNKDYSDNIFVDAEINMQGQITLNCKPGFADSRTFIVTTNLKEIEEQIKKYGEFYQGSYFLQNTKIEKNFRFSKLQSITLTKIGDNIISPQLTWTTKEIKGDVEFLQP
ncbi:MAG: hypothetical protein IM449_07260 [Microcystis sp. M065S1]|nr:hypothetical protein [Microcystis sp. M065S1]